MSHPCSAVLTACLLSVHSGVLLPWFLPPPSRPSHSSIVGCLMCLSLVRISDHLFVSSPVLPRWKLRSARCTVRSALSGPPSQSPPSAPRASLTNETTLHGPCWRRPWTPRACSGRSSHPGPQNGGSREATNPRRHRRLHRRRIKWTIRACRWRRVVAPVERTK